LGGLIVPALFLQGKKKIGKFSDTGDRLVHSLGARSGNGSPWVDVTGIATRLPTAVYRRAAQIIIKLMLS
jgi:hypothetical protein